MVNSDILENSAWSPRHHQAKGSQVFEISIGGDTVRILGRKRHLRKLEGIVIGKHISVPWREDSMHSRCDAGILVTPVFSKDSETSTDSSK